MTPLYRRTEASSLLSIHNREGLWTPLTLSSVYKQEGDLWTPTHLNKKWRRTKASSAEETCYRRTEASSLLSIHNRGGLRTPLTLSSAYKQEGDLWAPIHFNKKWRRTKASSAQETCYRRTEASSLLSIHNRGGLRTRCTLCSSYKQEGDLWTPTHHNQKWRRTKASSAEETCYRRTEASSLLSIHNGGGLWTPRTLCSSYK